MVNAAHVRAALDAKIDRHNLLETKIREMIEQNLVLIDTHGRRVGQVNGLSVMEIGGYAFGKPVRITASVALGKTGIINIERESNLSGRFHDKGMQIIAGYLRRTFAQDKPLSLSASVCFEQSYSGVDGDSASSTEIYALLSALSGLPIRQDLAVTGSVNQQGDMQPIGGVNQKIEGFYDVCRLKGLTGKQGVLIPAENVDDLMLRDEVIEAVARGPVPHLSGCDHRAGYRNPYRRACGQARRQWKIRGRQHLRKSGCAAAPDGFHSQEVQLAPSRFHGEQSVGRAYAASGVRHRWSTRELSIPDNRGSCAAAPAARSTAAAAVRRGACQIQGGREVI